MSLLLYVGSDRANPSRQDVGSVLCLALLDRLAEGTVQVRNASAMAREDRPIWLRGTPSLHCEETDSLWTGFEAFSHLQNMAFDACGKSKGPDLALSAPVQAESDIPESSVGEGKKFSGDDFAKAMEERSRTSVPVVGGSAPALPEPVKD